LIHAAELAPTLNAPFGKKLGLENQHIDGGAGMFVAHALRGEGFDASEDGTGRGTPLVPVAFHGAQDPDVSGEVTHPVGRNGGLETCIAFSCKDHGQDAGADIAPTLRSMNERDSTPNAGGQVAVAWSIMPQNSGKDYKARAVDVAQPLMSGAAGIGNQGGDLIQSASAVRRLTPRECERLQGFPDDYSLIPYRKVSAAKLDVDFIKYLLRGNPKHLTREDVERLAADGPRYKALGNSMAVPVMRWIGARINLIEALLAEEAAA
jgi:DNA (cytosine-5)-methyltransferase 1